MPFACRAWTPMTKKRPARTPRGIRCKTISKGPDMVPRVRRPCAKFETRCSTT